MPRNSYGQGNNDRQALSSVFAYSVVALPSNPASDTIRSPQRPRHQRQMRIPLPTRPPTPASVARFRRDHWTSNVAIFSQYEKEYCGNRRESDKAVRLGC